eukprot:243425_1
MIPLNIRIDCAVLRDNGKDPSYYIATIKSYNKEKVKVIDIDPNVSEPKVLSWDEIIYIPSKFDIDSDKKVYSLYQYFEQNYGYFTSIYYLVEEVMEIYKKYEMIKVKWDKTEADYEQMPKVFGRVYPVAINEIPFKTSPTYTRLMEKIKQNKMNFTRGTSL